MECPFLHQGTAIYFVIYLFFFYKNNEWNIYRFPERSYRGLVFTMGTIMLNKLINFGLRGIFLLICYQHMKKTRIKNGALLFK